MPFVAIPGTCKVEVNAHHADNLLPIVNVLHAKCSNAPSVVEITNLATAVADTVHGNLSCWGGGWILDNVRVTDLNTATGPQVTNTTHAGDIGGMGASTAASVCGLVKLLTATRSRRSRGRVFMSPVAGTQVSQDGILGAGAAGNYTAFFGALQSALALLAVPSILRVASRRAATGYDVTGFQVENGVASQRRRIGR